MKALILQMLFVAVLAAARGATVDRRSPTFSVPDFPRALEIVRNAAAQPGNINYDTFCAQRGQGGFKMGCQMKEMLDVGLLVCLESDICEPFVDHELSSLRKLVQAGLKVVAFYDEMISELKCGRRGSTDVRCFGYLVEWISASDGAGRSLRSFIYQGTEDTLLKWLKDYQVNESNYLVTADDLEDIVNFTDPGTGTYTRICDLQGFFFELGGFVIADPDDVVTGEPTSYTCSDQLVYPTTKRVIEALNHMVTSLRQ